MSEREELYRYRAWLSGGLAMAFFCEYKTIDEFQDAIDKGGVMKLRHTPTGAIPRSSSELIDIRVKAEDIRIIDNFYGSLPIVIGETADRIVKPASQPVVNMGQTAGPARVVNPGSPIGRRSK